MNGVAFARLKRPIKRPEGVRIIYKKRNNYRQQCEPSLRRPHSEFSLSESRATGLEFDGESIEEVKSYVKNRMKTEHGDKYESRASLSKNHTPTHRREDGKRSPAKSFKTFNCADQQPATPSRSPSKVKLRDNSQVSATGKESHLYKQLEQSIEDSCGKRLKTCLEFNQAKDWTASSNVDYLISEVKLLKGETNPQDGEDIELSDRKIGLLEQLMASTTVQSQILRKYYFSKLAKSKHRILKANSALSVDVNSRSPSPKEFISKRESLITSSAHRNSFRKPDQTAYKLERPSKDFFTSGRAGQPLPRSCYSRQFLNYRGLSSLPSSKPSNTTMINIGSSVHNIRSSSYQHEFTPKQSRTINYKQLDAYRNKYRNLAIVFGLKKEKEEEEGRGKLVNFKSKGKKVKEAKETRKEVPFLQSLLVSQSRKQFRKSTAPSPSRIKNENLHKLKYQYKSHFHV